MTHNPSRERAEFQMDTMTIRSARALEGTMGKSKRKRHQLREIENLELKEGEVIITPVESAEEETRPTEKPKQLIMKISHRRGA